VVAALPENSFIGESTDLMDFDAIQLDRTIHPSYYTATIVTDVEYWN